ncbi:LysR family transcriptional regulator [Roseixanthobacter pseudopolyaromaticivorans]|uniref:LysR family transcriptional regulator n=1 Tax=Xanthobacteraceae TaxID=335928 RepID=UPI00372735AE
MAAHFRTDLDWDQLRVFAALARHGSLSAAARVLGVNHSTVSRNVAGLEAAIGAPLLVRNANGYDLTEPGRRALDVAMAMERAALALLEQAPHDAYAGRVRVTATASLAEVFLLPHLAALQAQHPALDLELIANRRSVSLQRHEADIALRLARPLDGDLLARRACGVGLAFYATQAWHARIQRGEAPHFVGFDEAAGTLPEALWLARQYPRARFSFRTNSQAGQAQAAAAGCGIALLPHFLAAGHPGLTVLEMPHRPPARELWLLTRADARADARFRLVADALLDLFRRERTLFEGEG